MSTAIDYHRAAALDAYADAVELHRETVALMVGLVLDIVKIPRDMVAREDLRARPVGWDPIDEGLVLGALITGALAPADVEALPSDVFRHSHGPILDVLLAMLDLRASQGQRRGGVAISVVRWALRVAARDYPELGVLGGYVARLAREAPKRPAARAAVQRLMDRKVST